VFDSYKIILHEYHVSRAPYYQEKTGWHRFV
jgi:hypothetical protein